MVFRSTAIVASSAGVVTEEDTVATSKRCQWGWSSRWQWGSVEEDHICLWRWEKICERRWSSTGEEQMCGETARNCLCLRRRGFVRAHNDDDDLFMLAMATIPDWQRSFMLAMVTRTARGGGGGGGESGTQGWEMEGREDRRHREKKKWSLGLEKRRG